MDTDKIVIALYPRNQWQAFDLGTRLALAWWKPLLGVWLLTALPLFILASLIFKEWAMLFIWWLKPLFEMGLLHQLSRRLFQQQPGIQQTVLDVLPQLVRQAIPALTWRRLSPNRGFNLAVTQLEELTGEKRAKRLNILHRNTSGIYWWLIICVHIETLLMTGTFALLYMLVPEGSDWEYGQFLGLESANFYWHTNIIALVAMAIIAPIFQAGSFIAYINRRVILEGWDIELQFKAIANTLEKQKRTSTLSAFLLATVLLFSLSPVEIQAQEASNTDVQERVTSDDIRSAEQIPESEREIPPWAKRVKDRLNKTLESPPFTKPETSYDWEWHSWTMESGEETSYDFSSLQTIVAAIARFSEVIFWLVFVSALSAIIWLTRHQLARFFELFSQSSGNSNITTVVPDFLSSELRESSDEEPDYRNAINTAIAQQQWRQCVSLMLINSLQTMQTKYEFQLHESLTEGECLALLRQYTGEQEEQFLRVLFEQWTVIAWSHNLPTEETIEKLVSHWQQLMTQG